MSSGKQSASMMFEYFEPENFVDSHRQSYKLIRNKVQLQSHTQKSNGFYYTYGQKRDRVGEDPHNRGVIFQSDPSSG